MNIWGIKSLQLVAPILLDHKNTGMFLRDPEPIAVLRANPRVANWDRDFTFTKD